MKIESPPTWEELDVGAPRETLEPLSLDTWQLLDGGIAVKLEKGGLKNCRLVRGITRCMGEPRT